MIGRSKVIFNTFDLLSCNVRYDKEKTPCAQSVFRITNYQPKLSTTESTINRVANTLVILIRVPSMERPLFLPQ